MPRSFDTVSTLYRPLSTAQHDDSPTSTAAVDATHRSVEDLTSQRGSVMSCRLDGARLLSTYSPELFLLGDEGVARELATARQVSSSLLDSHNATPQHGTVMAAALSGIIGDAQNRAYGTPRTPSSVLWQADEDSGTPVSSSSSHAAPPPPTCRGRCRGAGRKRYAWQASWARIAHTGAVIVGISGICSAARFALPTTTTFCGRQRDSALAAASGARLPT